MDTDNLGYSEIKYLLDKWNLVKLSGMEVDKVVTEITDCLSGGEKWRQLESFLREVDCDYPGIFEELCNKNERFLLQVIALRRHFKDYEEVYRLIRKGKFTDTNAMLDLWDEVHYEEISNGDIKKLSPVKKFRIRQKNPPPLSICPSGIRPTCTFSRNAKKILKEWLEQRRSYPYPSKTEKTWLCSQTGLTMKQLETWFANNRRRNLMGKKKVGRPSKPKCKKGDIEIKESVAVEGMLALSETLNETIPTDLEVGKVTEQSVKIETKELFQYCMSPTTYFNCVYHPHINTFLEPDSFQSSHMMSLVSEVGFFAPNYDFLYNDWASNVFYSTLNDGLIYANQNKPINPDNARDQLLENSVS
ncbi:homeobox protein SIX2-like [Centruroides vittatus]|uniref:homeobox protein SIX2-like n=1 Tax=Centruroides vittatus TaxID=120091 RepID=UPI0035108CE7